MVQLLIRSGRNPEEAMMILVPEAYKNHPTLSIKYPEVFFFVITDILCSVTCSIPSGTVINLHFV